MQNENAVDALAMTRRSPFRSHKALALHTGAFITKKLSLVHIHSTSLYMHDHVKGILPKEECLSIRLGLFSSMLEGPCAMQGDSI